MNWKTELQEIDFLAYAHAFSYRYDDLLRWSEKSLYLLESNGDLTSGQLKAIASNNIAFALYYFCSGDYEKMQALADYAYERMPWENGVVRTTAAVKIRLGFVEEGVELLEKHLAENLCNLRVNTGRGLQKTGSSSSARRSAKTLQGIGPVLSAKH